MDVCAFKWAVYGRRTVVQLSGQLSDCVCDPRRCDPLCLVPASRPLPSPPPPVLGSEVGRERGCSRWPPALHAETMATCRSVTAGDRNRHKHRNRPFCHWGRAARAWESGEGTLSLFQYALIWQKVIHLLIVCCCYGAVPKGVAPSATESSGMRQGYFKIQWCSLLTCVPSSGTQKLYSKIKQTT